MISAIVAVVEFLRELLPFLKGLQKTPAQKEAGIVGEVRDASRKADETKGDTSDYERVLRG
jgi:hypothetical protein